MEQEQHRGFKASWFFKWFINNKVVAALAIVLLLLLNILLLNKVGFIFKPVGEFITVISLPVILAAVFYYLLNPIVDFLEKKMSPTSCYDYCSFLNNCSFDCLGLNCCYS